MRYAPHSFAVALIPLFAGIAALAILAAPGIRAAVPGVGAAAPDLPTDGWVKDAPPSVKLEDYRGDVLIITHF